MKLFFGTLYNSKTLNRLQPDLSGALFLLQKRKKREWKADKAAQNILNPNNHPKFLRADLMLLPAAHR